MYIMYDVSCGDMGPRGLLQFKGRDGGAFSVFCFMEMLVLSPLFWTLCSRAMLGPL